jgi:hypothetical protein
VKLAFPTVEQERMALARARAGLSLRDAPWRSSRLIPRVIFFVLTLFCIAAGAGLLAIMRLPEELFIAIAAIAVAEMLISQMRLFHAGPEEALWIAGTLALVFALPGSPSDEAALLIAAAFAASGVRVRNPLFLTVAIALVPLYLGLKLGSSEPGSLIALAVGFSALALSSRQREDPLHEQVLALLVMAMPIAAWGFSLADGPRAAHWQARIVAALLVAAIFLPVGLVRRYRPAILGGIAGALIGGYELDRMLRWPGAVRFLLWGVVLLALSALAVALLRKRRSGLTSEKLDEIEGFGLIETAAAAVAVPRHEQGERPIGAGGSFGGAGASGEY